MTERAFTLGVLAGTFAVCRLPPDAGVPAWAGVSPFLSVTRTGEELSVVSPGAAVPAGVRCERGWRCLRVSGTLDFNQVGVLASLLVPLAGAGVSVFAVSTFDTDYLLVKEADFEQTLAVLQQAGHSIQN